MSCSVVLLRCVKSFCCDVLFRRGFLLFELDESGTETMILTIALLTFLSLFADGHDMDRRFSYVLLPMDLSHLGSSRQYFHIYITSWHDAEVEITVPDTTQRGPHYRQRASLSRNNSWAWREVYTLTGNLLTKAISRGFRLTSSAPIVAYALRYTSRSYGYLTAYQALALTSDDTSFVLGTYHGKVKKANYDAFYVICSWGNPTNYTSSNGTIRRTASLAPFQTAVRTVLHDDGFIGWRIDSTEPVSVFAGNRRSSVPFSTSRSEVQYAKPLFQQIPPVGRLGTVYVIGPVPGRFASSTKCTLVVAFPDGDNPDVELRYDPDFGEPLAMADPAAADWAVTSFPGRWLIRSKANATVGRRYLELANSRADLPLLLTCSEPCLPSLLKHTDLSGDQQTSGYLSTVAPPSRIPMPFRIFVPGQLEGDVVDDTYVVVVTDADRRRPTIDGVPLSEYPAIGSCNVSYVGTWSVTSCRVAYGVHVIDDVDGDASMAVHVHGYALKQECKTCYSSAYAFPAFYPGEVYTELTKRQRPSSGVDPGQVPSTESSDRAASTVDVISLTCIVLLIVVVCGFMWLVVRLTREIQWSRRRCSLPDPGAPDQNHTYLCPTSNDGPRNCYARDSTAGASSKSATADESLYCDL